MPLDTSIPLQVQMPQFAEPVDAATQQFNALRKQALQQEMMRNQLIMQNTMQDRARAEQDRRVAAAQAAEERRRLGEYRGVLSNFGVTPAVVGQRGAGYSGTGVQNDPYASIQNELLKRGFVPQAEELAKLQKEQLLGQESQAKLPGLTAESRKKGTEADTAEYDAAVARLTPLVRMVKNGQDAASFTNAMYDDPTLGPKLDKIIPRAQAVARAAGEYEANPLAWTQSHMLTGKELSDAMVAAQPKTVEYETVQTDQGPVRIAKTSAGEATPLTVAGERVQAPTKGGLTENQKMQLKARTSDDFGAATETLRYAQDIERDIKSLTDTDISGATGYQSYLPSFKENTIRTEKTLTELRDKVGALGRTLASMSGKLGNLAVQEYEFLRQQVALIDPTAGEKDVRRQLAKAETSMKRITNTVRDRYSREYGGEDNPFTQFRELPKEVGADAKTGSAKAGTTSSGISYSIED